jgi:transcription initiation factor TFIID subunit 5
MHAHYRRCFVAGHQADVDVVRWHPNCHYVATASSDRSVRLWDVGTGACVRFLLGLRGAPTSMELSPDGRQVCLYVH